MRFVSQMVLVYVIRTTEALVADSSRLARWTRAHQQLGY
jgi:hypothetical protein